MKKYNGAVFFDFDGTLVDEREKIYSPTETTLNSIKELRKNNYMIGLATGRSKCYIPETTIDFDCYVTSNGAFASVDEKVVFNDLISDDDLKSLINFFEERDMGYMTENQEKCYYGKTGQQQFIEMMEVFNMNMDCFYPIPDGKKIEVNKLMFNYINEADAHELIDTFREKYLIAMHRSNPSGDLVKSYISKATGIEHVIKEFDLDISDTFAFGDGENDFEMLGAVGHGITMGVHAKKLEKVAEHITDTVVNEGVTKGLRKYGLI